MKLLYSLWLGQNVGALQQSAKVGIVRDVAVEPESGKILGLILSNNIYSLKLMTVSWQDIVDIDNNTTVINDKENILSIGEIVRINELYLENFHIVGLPVHTTSGKNLGSVRDFEVDTTLGELTKIFVRFLWGAQKIITRSNILHIKKDKIIVKNMIAREIVTKPATETA